MPARTDIAHLPSIRFCGRFAGSHAVPFHVHEESELVLVTQGTCTIHLRHGESFTGTIGSIFVLPAQVPHDQINDGICRTTYIGFDGPRLGYADRARVSHLIADDAAARWMEDACSLWACGPVAEAALSAVLLAVLERLRALEEQDAQVRSLPRAVVEGTRWIERHLLDRITVADVARATDRSPSHLTALFRSHLGCPPLRYQQRLRLVLARRLLGNSYLSIEEIATACGYEDASYFIRIFRAVIGVTPSRWRRGERPASRRTRYLEPGDG